MSAGAVAAIDLGATSGRVMIGHVGDGLLQLEPIARFANDPVQAGDGLHIDILRMYGAALAGLRDAFRAEPRLASIGVDSWAVDYGLLRDGSLVGNPFHYRDPRSAHGVASVHARMPHAALYARNGLQFLPFTTLYQLAAEPAARLAFADTVLLIPDLIGFWLTGNARAERTNASTTGLLRAGAWDDGLAELLGLPQGILPSLIAPGEALGMLQPAVAAAVCGDAPVVAVGSHDTASAVVAVPMADPTRAAYISCGTWGLVGIELDAPVMTDAARTAAFTNEGGVDGRVRFLHNVTGLWLLSESVRAWEAHDGRPIDLPALLTQAAAVTGPTPLFDANDQTLSTPGDMPARIAVLLQHGGHPVPADRATMVRTIIESIAQAFADAVHTVARVTGRTLQVVHIVGGGSLNALLCQATADRAQLPVSAGPVEATALGNVLVQARTAGAVSGSLEALRDLVARTQRLTLFRPGPS
ncbi:rhamnulokinase family protein [Microbacterium kribbense]|uniref:Rhamnulokinase family protein n=1 Tax=Microbacterium kribbense TaxID=433645 RepID=A0ABP7G731_9MICO